MEMIIVAYSLLCVLMKELLQRSTIVKKGRYVDCLSYVPNLDFNISAIEEECNQ